MLDLKRGDLVVALEIPDWVSPVRPGTRGVVFEEANAYGDGNGPMVRWVDGTACNVYTGWVAVVDTDRGADRVRFVGSDAIQGDYRITHRFVEGDARPGVAQHLVMEPDEDAAHQDRGMAVVAEPGDELHLSYWVRGEEFVFDGFEAGRHVLRAVSK